jgi:hypothetical protein
MADVFTNAGEDFVTDLVDGTISAPANWYIAWGTGAGTAAVTDTTLFTEASEARVVATESQPTSRENRFVGTITCAGAGKTITNAGVLSASTTGTLFLKSDFTGVALNVGDSIQFTFTIAWGA